MPDMATVEQTTSQTARCCLLDVLPPELRCIIYDLLVTTRQRTLYAIAGTLYTSRIATEHTRPSGLAPLLRSCKDIYQEALPVLYRQTRFNMIITPTHDIPHKISWPTKVSNADLITNARLSISFRGGEYLTIHQELRLTDCLQLLDHGRKIRDLYLVVNRLNHNSDAQVDGILELLETLECEGEVSFQLWDGATSFYRALEEFYQGTGYDRLCLKLEAKAKTFSGERHRACEPEKTVLWRGKQQASKSEGKGDGLVLA